MSNERLRETLKQLQAEHAILIAKGDRITIWSPLAMLINGYGVLYIARSVKY